MKHAKLCAKCRRTYPKTPGAAPLSFLLEVMDKANAMGLIDGGIDSTRCINCKAPLTKATK